VSDAARPSFLENQMMRGNSEELGELVGFYRRVKQLQRISNRVLTFFLRNSNVSEL